MQLVYEFFVVTNVEFNGRVVDIVIIVQLMFSEHQLNLRLKKKLGNLITVAEGTVSNVIWAG